MARENKPAGKPAGKPADKPSVIPGARRVRMPGSAAIKGRGAASQVVGRFEKTRRQGEDDGWGSLYADDEVELLPPLHTQVVEERARSIISRNDSPDIGFSQSVNPYRGCEHGITIW